MSPARPSSTGTAKLTIALVGNPNTGKSTLFSGLCGVPARIGNYPGVTVEKKIGRYRDAEGTVAVVDLPGTYSLAACTLDEKVSVDVLLDRQRDGDPIDLIVAVVDATNLERNLYLFTQLRQLEKPVLIVLNMWDRVEAGEIQINLPELQERLGAPVVVAAANKKRGIQEIKTAIRHLAAQPAPEPPSMFSPGFQGEVEQVAQILSPHLKQPLPNFLVERLLLDRDSAHAAELASQPELATLPQILEASRARLADAGVRLASFEATSRYRWIRTQLDGVATRPTTHTTTRSDRIDGFMTHRVWGLLAFMSIMFVVFQAITWGTTWVMGKITDDIQPWATGWVESILPAGTLQSLINDGLIAGVGSVVIFLPQILMLFFFIGLLEDCGYMARAAFVMDKLMTKLGLSGKSFLPLMSSFACAVPGIMATRVIENRRDRMVTILVAPLMSCSARLPVYVLLTTAFIPDIRWLSGWIGLPGIVLFLMHLVGVLVAVPIAWLLKKFIFPGDVPPFVLELPSYKLPSPTVVFYRVWERAYAFLFRAGSLIFCTSILVWAAGYFPGDHTQQHDLQRQLVALQNASPEPASDAEAQASNADRSEELASQLRVESGKLMEASFLGKAGHTIEPVVKPLGWDWRIGVGVVASFPAREVIIATLGTIYSLGGEAEDENLMQAISAARWPDGRPVYTIPVALSIMVFFALCAQCAATLMVIKRETNSWFWPAFTFVYMTGIAYIAALITYQVGSLWIS